MITLGSAVLSAALLSAVYSPLTAAIVMLVIIAHEFGHYFTARKYTQAYLPIFFPAIFVVFGLTAVERSSDSNIMYQIYRQGNIWGICTAAALVVLAIEFGALSTAINTVSIGVYEVYSASYGSDGRRIKRLRQRKNGMTSTKEID